MRLLTTHNKNRSYRPSSKRPKIVENMGILGLIYSSKSYKMTEASVNKTVCLFSK